MPYILLGGPIFVVGMMAAVQTPLAAIMPDSRFAPRMVEMDDLIAEDVDVDDAANFVWELC